MATSTTAPILLPHGTKVPSNLRSCLVSVRIPAESASTDYFCQDAKRIPHINSSPSGQRHQASPTLPNHNPGTSLRTRRRWKTTKESWLTCKLFQRWYQDCPPLKDIALQLRPPQMQRNKPHNCTYEESPTGGTVCPRLKQSSESERSRFSPDIGGQSR